MLIGNVSVKELVKEYGTPMYVYDQGKIEEKLKMFHDHFQSDVFETEVIYASKAFNCKAMTELVKECDCGMDVVSGGELYTAHVCDFDMKRMYFHGNNKSVDELKMAIKYGVGTIVVDNMMELDTLISLKPKDTHVLIRLNPGVEAHTHKYIVTADIDSKFGISIEEKDEIRRMIDKINHCDGLTFDGFHAHIGSQIFDPEAYVKEIEVLAKFLSEMHVDCHVLDLGGGFASCYTSEDHPIPVDEVCKTIVDTCVRVKDEYHLNVEKICIEPGRSIVAEAGSTIYTVGFMKDTKHKHYLFVDGGMSDNIRPALYQAKYECDIDGKEDEIRNVHYKIAGKCCESGDVLIEDALLPEVKSGDHLVVYTTGAYGYSMASHYNKNLLPPVIFCKDGKHKEVIRRETYEDLIRLENLTK